MTIQGKHILLGVCGGIAAYKAAFLIRLLVKAGAEVRVVMTPDARSFVTPLTLSTLSGNPVLIDYFDPGTGEWNNHVHHALWADVMLIAPTTANTISKFAHGACDNLLTAIYLSAKSPVFIAPAMDLDMWQHASTKHNIVLLRSYGVRIIEPGHGQLASGLVGEGRLAEPEEIFRQLELFFSISQSAVAGDAVSDRAFLQNPLSGRKALVTAGPTQEAIDPVRYISNHSSGKMGFAIARVLAEQGVQVDLVYGPASVDVPVHPLIRSRAVVSAAQMLGACLELGESSDLIVMAAAVADYTPVEIAPQKIKKSGDTPPSTINYAAEVLSIPLKKTDDILARLGQDKKPGQFLVGFALETEQEEAHALSKLERKHLDMIVLNSLQDKGAGFGTDTNKITIFTKSGKRTVFPLKLKEETARDIVSQILNCMQDQGLFVV